jgi:hypothetical protein
MGRPSRALQLTSFLGIAWLLGLFGPPVLADDGWLPVHPDGMRPGTQAVSVVDWKGELFIGTAPPPGERGAELWVWRPAEESERLLRLDDATALRVASFGGGLAVGTEGASVHVLISADGERFAEVPVFSRMLGIERITPMTLGPSLFLLADTHGGPRLFGSDDGVRFWQAVRSVAPRFAAAIRTVVRFGVGDVGAVRFQGALYVGASTGRRAELWRTEHATIVDRLLVPSRGTTDLIPQTVFEGRLYLMGAGPKHLDVRRTVDGTRFPLVLRIPASEGSGIITSGPSGLILAASTGSGPDAILAWGSVDGERWEPLASFGGAGERLGSLIAVEGSVFATTSPMAGGDRVWSLTGNDWRLITQDPGPADVEGVARLIPFEGGLVLLHGDLAEGWWTLGVTEPHSGNLGWTWVLVGLGLVAMIAASIRIVAPRLPPVRRPRPRLQPA